MYISLYNVCRELHVERQEHENSGYFSTAPHKYVKKVFEMPANIVSYYNSFWQSITKQAEEMSC